MMAAMRRGPWRAGTDTQGEVRVDFEAAEQYLELAARHGILVLINYKEAS